MNNQTELKGTSTRARMSHRRIVLETAMRVLIDIFFVPVFLCSRHIRVIQIFSACISYQTPAHFSSLSSTPPKSNRDCSVSHSSDTRSSCVRPVLLIFEHRSELPSSVLGFVLPVLRFAAMLGAHRLARDKQGKRSLKLGPILQ